LAKKIKKGIKDDVTKAIDDTLKRDRLPKSEPLRRAAIAKRIQENIDAELAKIEGAGVSDPTANVPVKPSTSNVPMFDLPGGRRGGRRGGSRHDPSSKPSTSNVPVKPSTQVAIPEDSRYHKLVKLQSLFRLKEHIDKNKQKWGAADSTVTALPPSRPFSTVPTILSESYFEMYNYFKEIGNWSEVDLRELQDYKRQGGSRTQTDFLVKHGFLKEVNPRWIDINPDKTKPRAPKGFVAKEPDGTKIVSEYQGTNLPKIDVTYRKENGKFYRKEFDYEITSKGRKYIQEEFKILAPPEGISDIETFLPSEYEGIQLGWKEPSSTLLEDVTYEVLPEPVDPNMPPEGTLSRQEAIIESKKRREERQLERKQSRGYVDKPSISKPPTELSAPRMPSLGGRTSTASEAAGREALPGGGGGKGIPRSGPPKMPKKNMRMGGFIPYST
jgi:hypothetical protein